MFLSKLSLVIVCWEMCLAAVVIEDVGECAAIPRKAASLGKRALLQHSGQTHQVPAYAPTEVSQPEPVPTDSLSSADPNANMDASSEPAVEQETVPPQQMLGIIQACDFQCYLNRYPDLQSVVKDDVTAAEQHWNSIGKAEGRDCTCAAGEVNGGTAEEGKEMDKDTELAMLRDQVQQLEVQKLGQAQTGDGAAGDPTSNIMDFVTSCLPLEEAAQEALQKEISDYEASEKFQEKIAEAKGEIPATAGHASIMKYLHEKVLEPNWSVLELGCAAGGVLAWVEREYEKNIGEHGALVGVELVTGWVDFAQDYYENIQIFKGDITEYSLPEPYTTTTFDFVMLNDVMEHVQKTRYGCFFSELERVTHPGSVVYMHTPSPMAQLEDKTQYYENVVPHAFVVTGMALHGFELIKFEYDMDTYCGAGSGEEGIPRQLQGAGCYMNGWPKYTHNVYRKVASDAVLNVA